jgi:hypothetical protein
MELSEFYKNKAFKELREDEFRRSQSLEQFREWISKQTHINYCRTGSKKNLNSSKTKVSIFQTTTSFFVSCESRNI